MTIREYKSSDCKELAELFYNTVHTINAKDYTKEQLDVWATGQIDLEKWNLSFQEHYSIVAVDDDIIIGFGDIDKTGYLNRLFVHKDYQKKGVATAICDKLERIAQKLIIVHASVTAAAAPQPTRIMRMRGDMRNTRPRLEPMAAPVYTIGPSAPTDPPKPMVTELAITEV